MLIVLSVCSHLHEFCFNLVLHFFYHLKSHFHFRKPSLVSFSAFSNFAFNIDGFESLSESLSIVLTSIRDYFIGLKLYFVITFFSNFFKLIGLIWSDLTKKFVESFFINFVSIDKCFGLPLHVSKQQIIY